MKLNSKPSKFQGGVSNLWMGISLEIFYKYFKKAIFDRKINTEIDGVLTFESARSALSAALFSCKVKKGDEVIVSSFTCSAVSYAVIETGAKIVYVDVNNNLTMNFNDVKNAITKKTKAIIIQNTFGNLGLNENEINYLKDKGLLTIEDNCLSYGSKFQNKNLGNYGDLSIWSLEVSKTITLGWGGVLQINNQIYKKNIEDFYNKIPTLKKFSDLMRLAQLFLSLYLIKNNSRYGKFIWYFLYGTKIFRRSNQNYRNINKSMVKMGCFTKRIYLNILPHIDTWLIKSNKNIIEISKYAKKLNFELPIMYDVDEYRISPRFSLFLTEKALEKAIELAHVHNIEISRLFDECPPTYKKLNSFIYSNSNADAISKKIINIPVYWTYSNNEIEIIKNYLDELSKFK